MIQLVASEEVDSFGNLFLSLLFGEGLAAVNVCQDVLLTGSLKRSTGSFDLNNKIPAVFCFVVFKHSFESTNLPLSSVETVLEIFLGGVVHMHIAYHKIG